jgi:transposase
MCFTMLVGMRPFGTAGELEKRRRRAIALLQAGNPYREVARVVGASLSSVVRWKQACRRDTQRGLRARPTPGRPPRLTTVQQDRLRQVLFRGARAAGHTTELWTQAHRQGDRDAVRRPLQSGRRLEALAARPRLELAETRTAGAPARRGGHRTLEDEGVAPYKKTPLDVGPTSCFSMKAAFC